MLWFVEASPVAGLRSSWNKTSKLVREVSALSRNNETSERPGEIGIMTVVKLTMRVEDDMEALEHRVSNSREKVSSTPPRQML